MTNPETGLNNNTLTVNLGKLDIDISENFL
jgi:hypothetical protein